MNEQRRSGHTVTRFTAHLVWVTKYRYPVLKGDVKQRCRELIIQICDAEEANHLIIVPVDPVVERPESVGKVVLSLTWINP